jgi:hypothetical protein
MRSGHYVGKIDHGLGVGYQSDEERDDGTQPTVTFPQRCGAIREYAQNVGALDQDEATRLLAQWLRQVVAISCDFLGYRGQGDVRRASFFSRSLTV